MKKFFKNFFTLLKRYRLSSSINILGMALALSAFYVIWTQVYYSLTYNKSIKDYDRIYLISAMWNHSPNGDIEWSVQGPSPISLQAFEQSAVTEDFSHMRIYPFATEFYLNTDNGDFKKFNYGSYDIGSGGVELFGFEPVEGDLKRLEEPNTVIISDKLAQQLDLSVGDMIYYNSVYHTGTPSSKVQVCVVGIFKAFARNTFLSNFHIFRDDKCKDGQTNNNWNYCNFVKLQENADPKGYEKVWTELYTQFYKSLYEEYNLAHPDDSLDFNEEEIRDPVRLIPLNKLYYSSELITHGVPLEQNTISKTIVLILISLLILLVALFNFVNFCMGMVPFRIRNVNISKILGATQGELRLGLLLESFAMIMIACAIALLGVYLMKDSFITEYLTSSLEFSENIPVLLIMLVAVLISLSASIYPTLYLTRIKVAMAVRESFAGSVRGRRIRTILVGFQFTAAMILVIVCGVLALQYRFVVNYNVGFDKENMVVVSDFDMINIDSDTFITKLTENPDIESVTASESLMVGFSSAWGREYQGTPYQLYVWFVRWNFPDVFKINILEGSGFSNENQLGSEILISKDLNEDIGIPVGETISGIPIVGIIPDLYFTNVASGQNYCGIVSSRSSKYSNYYIRISPGAHFGEVSEYISSVITELNPDIVEPAITLYEDTLLSQYDDSKKDVVAIAIFAIIAMLITQMGVVGVLLFETAHRRSDVAIRKVYGATSAQMVRMLSTHYIKQVFICFAIAAPVAWRISELYLDNFVNRITIPYWLFVVALLTVLSITVILVYIRTLKAANENPIEVLNK